MAVIIFGFWNVPVVRNLINPLKLFTIGWHELCHIAAVGNPHTHRVFSFIRRCLKSLFLSHLVLDWVLAGDPIWRQNTQNHHRSQCGRRYDSRGRDSRVRAVGWLHRVNAFRWGVRTGGVGYISGKDPELCPWSGFGVAFGAGQR